MALCAGFIACSSDDKHDIDIDTHPIKGLELPKSDKDQPLEPGQEITIKGQGFTESSEIWFKTLVKITNEGIKAKVTGVDKAGITFVAPDVYGSQTVTLKQSGKEYPLGTLVFEDTPKIIKKRIAKWVKNDKDLVEFAYNKENRLEKIIDNHEGISYKFGYNTQGLLVAVNQTELDSNEEIFNKKITYKDENTILVDEVYPDDPEGNATMTITLNNNGLITKRADGVEFYETYEYDNLGNLTKLVEAYYGDEGENKEYPVTYTYDDKLSYLSNQNLPQWFWIYNADDKYLNYAGPNNMISDTYKDDTTKYKYDYDELGYPTTRYKEANNGFVEEVKFVYEIIE